MTKYKILGTKPLANSEVEIECEIEAEIVASYKPKAVTKIQKDLSLPGFRPGHVPEAILIKQVGELAVYETMADLAINDFFPEIITETNISFITTPQVQITKLADKNPILFKITGPALPEIKLPEYKKIAKIENEIIPEPTTATEKELEETIEEIRKNYASLDKNSQESGGWQEIKTKPEEGENPAAEKTADPAPETEAKANPLPVELPEVSLDWVKKLGNFETIEDFKNKIKENIQKEKEAKAKDRKRMAIIEKILADTKIDLPKILIDRELHRMRAQFEDDIVKAGLKVEDYLKHLGKTSDELAKDWTPDAEKRVKVQLIITKIAQTEKIEADAETVKKEVATLLETYKDATEEPTKAYVKMMLTNNKVFEYLEQLT